MIVFLKEHGKEIYAEVRAAYVDTMNKVNAFFSHPPLHLALCTFRRLNITCNNIHNSKKANMLPTIESQVPTITQHSVSKF